MVREARRGVPYSSCGINAHLNVITVRIAKKVGRTVDESVLIKCLIVHTVVYNYSHVMYVNNISLFGQWIRNLVNNI